MAEISEKVINIAEKTAKKDKSSLRQLNLTQKSCAIVVAFVKTHM